MCERRKVLLQRGEQFSIGVCVRVEELLGSGHERKTTRGVLAEPDPIERGPGTTADQIF